MGGAYALGWLDLISNSAVPGPNKVWDGHSLLHQLTTDLSGYRSRLVIRYRAIDRRIRKFTRSGPKFSTQLAYAPPRLRLGQVFRILRLLAISGFGRGEGSYVKFTIRSAFMLWSLGGLSDLRRVQNLQLRAYARGGRRARMVLGWLSSGKLKSDRLTAPLASRRLLFLAASPGARPPRHGGLVRYRLESCHGVNRNLIGRGPDAFGGPKMELGVGRGSRVASVRLSLPDVATLVPAPLVASALTRWGPRRARARLCCATLYGGWVITQPP